MTDETTRLIQPETLIRVLSTMLGVDVTRADSAVKRLHGGTLGDVRLVTGTATAAGGEERPYRVVWKTQKKWERPGDPDSWRREYDLYAYEPDGVFTEALRRSACYHAELNAGGDEMQLWLEYIEGVSGGDLTIGMLERAALEWGRFQGRLSQRGEAFSSTDCLGDPGFMKREFAQWHTQTFSYEDLLSAACPIPERLKRLLKDGGIQLVEGKSFEYACLRSSGCGLPAHLKRMLMDIDESREPLFDALKTLPVVLCHRDFWNENIFVADGGIRLIDWDTAGWGFAGEDIASLIADGMDVGRFEENRRRLIPAYLRGLSEHRDVTAVDESVILTMTLVKFGYRMLQEYLFSEDPAESAWGLNALQKIYEMRHGT